MAPASHCAAKCCLFTAELMNNSAPCTVSARRENGWPGTDLQGLRWQLCASEATAKLRWALTHDLGKDEGSIDWMCGTATECCPAKGTNKGS